MLAETTRLIIRDLQHDDLAGMLAISSDPEVERLIEEYLPAREASMREWLAGTIWHNEQQPRLSYNCAILLKATQRVIGWIGFGKPSSPQKGDIDLGYAIHRDFWNHGYMTEALRATLAFCFEELYTETVTAYHMNFNPASGRVMQKAGMRLHEELMQGCENGEVHYIITLDMWRCLVN